MRILHIVLNEFVHDNRVIRSASTGVELGADVQVFALHNAGLAERETMEGFLVRRFRLTTRPWSKHKVIQLAKYGEVIGRMLTAGRQFRPDLVHVHDLNALPIGYGISRLSRARLIYDSHELWADPMHRRTFPPWMFRLGLALERMLARRADAVLTVSPGIAREMANNMRVDLPVVIRNLPVRQPGRAQASRPGLREALQIGEDVPIILYQGFVAAGRGVSVLLEAMRFVTHPRVVLVFLGSGAQIPELRQRAEALHLGSRVFFHPAVPPLELPHYTREADVGVCPIEATCLSYRLALPNKLFEYVQSGLPVVVSDLPEMKAVVEDYEIGVAFREGNAKDLGEKLDFLLLDEKRLADFRSRADAAALELNWEQESERLKSVYRRVLPAKAAGR